MDAKENNQQPEAKKPISFGWVVLIGPLTIVIGLSIFHGLPWVKEESKKGAQAEALTSNSLGRSRMNEGRYEEAYNLFATAMHIKPDYAEPYMNMGILYHLMGEDEGAISYMNQAIALNPKKKNVIYNNLGMIYAAQAQYDTAEVMFHKALELGIKPAPIWRNIGQIKTAQEDWRGAIKAYQNALRNRPILKNLYLEMLNETLYAQENEDYVDKVVAHIERGVTDEDVAGYDSVIVNQFLSRDEKVAEDLANIAKSCDELGLIDEASRFYQSALNIKPGDANLRNKLGILCARSGELEKAFHQFKEAVKLDPNNNDARFNLEHCEQKMTEEK